jgi:hypothetical protein
MRQIRQDAQAIRDDRVALPVLDLRDEADAAGIVLVARIVQPLHPDHHRSNALPAAPPLTDEAVPPNRMQNRG